MGCCQSKGDQKEEAKTTQSQTPQPNDNKTQQSYAQKAKGSDIHWR